MMTSSRSWPAESGLRTFFVTNERMFVALALAVAAPARAGNASYAACCAAMGETSCPVDLVVTGPGTAVTNEAGAVRLSGVWQSTCERGPGFEQSQTYALQSAPPTGTILTALGPGAAACWDAACAMPPGLCVRAYVGTSRIVDCATGAAPDASAWTLPPAAASVAVVVDGRVVKARPLDPVPGLAVTAVADAGPAVTRAPPLSLSVPVPPPPKLPCVPNPALANAAKSQVNSGDKSVVAGNWNEAASNYIAALSIDKCSAFAWAGLGEAFLVTGDAPSARTALTSATGLMPQHYQAWTNLGLAEETLGNAAAAAAAFDRALTIKPDHLPASEGLERVR
jgi:hypothetical protein